MFFCVRRFIHLYFICLFNNETINNQNIHHKMESDISTKTTCHSTIPLTRNFLQTHLHPILYIRVCSIFYLEYFDNKYAELFVLLFLFRFFKRDNISIFRLLFSTNCSLRRRPHSKPSTKYANIISLSAKFLNSFLDEKGF